jgi:hypothetical protein
MRVEPRRLSARRAHTGAPTAAAIRRLAGLFESFTAHSFVEFVRSFRFGGSTANLGSRL